MATAKKTEAKTKEPKETPTKDDVQAAIDKDREACLKAMEK